MGSTVEEMLERTEWRFVPYKPSGEDYLNDFKKQFGGKITTNRETFKTLNTTIDSGDYVLREHTKFGEIGIVVSEGKNLVAELVLYLTPSTSCARAIVVKQMCPDNMLEKIIRTIAPKLRDQRAIKFDSEDGRPI